MVYEKTLTSAARETETYKTQISRFVEGDRILDVSDMLSCDPRRNKVALTIVEFDGSFRATKRVRHYVDADDFKLICHDILAGGLTHFQDSKGSIHTDAVESRVLTIRRAGRSTGPTVFQIDNGVGEPKINGTVAMAQITESLCIALPRRDARKLALTVLDYIRQWETINFRRRQETRSIPYTGAVNAA